MQFSYITSKGQTTLPVAVRKALNVKPGDRLCYAILEDEVRLKVERPVFRLFGALEYHGEPVSLEDMEQAIADEAIE